MFSQFALGSNASDIGTPVAQTPDAPGQFSLLGNAPNPFRDATTIRYVLPEPAHVQLEVYDVLGRKVATLADEWQAAGLQQARFDASQLPAGIFVYRLQAGRHTITRFMVRVR